MESAREGQKVEGGYSASSAGCGNWLPVFPGQSSNRDIIGTPYFSGGIYYISGPGRHGWSPRVVWSRAAAKFFHSDSSDFYQICMQRCLASQKATCSPRESRKNTTSVVSDIRDLAHIRSDTSKQTDSLVYFMDYSSETACGPSSIAVHKNVNTRADKRKFRWKNLPCHRDIFLFGFSE